MSELRVSRALALVAIILPVMLSSCGVFGREDHDFSKRLPDSEVRQLEGKWSTGVPSAER